MVSNNYKPTVSALILNKDDEILLTHNKNHGSNFWKLPQGGIKRGESEVDAIRREPDEELNSNKFTILKKSNVEYKYHWPKEVLLIINSSVNLINPFSWDFENSIAA